MTNQPHSYIFNPKEMKTCFHNNVALLIYSGFTHNHQKMENNSNILQLLNGYTVIHPYNGIIPRNKKQCTTNTQNTEVNLKCIMPSERNHTQKNYIV